MTHLGALYGSVENRLPKKDLWKSTCLITEEKSGEHIVRAYRLHYSRTSKDKRIYYHALDVLANDLKHRFDDDALSILKDIRTFTSGELLKENSDIKAENIHLFCTHYQFNEDEVIRELKDFSVVYQQCHHLIDMSDVLQPTLVRQMEIEDDEDLQMDSHWLRNTFYQPFRLLMQLSGFPMLTTVYKVRVREF
jgi:hypothetical protein